jgi:uncharacterized protein YbcV (DUF1398 family)
MNDRHEQLARTCLEGADTGSMSFPEIVGALIAGGFDGYLVDLRRATTIYYPRDGEAIALRSHAHGTTVAERFDASAVQTAIREAQTQAPGYTYRGFCDKIGFAGCAGYLVSFPGRRVLYFGRTAEVHVEHFPQ